MAQIANASRITALRGDLLKYGIFGLLSLLISNTTMTGGQFHFGIALVAAVPLKISYIVYVGQLVGHLLFGNWTNQIPYLAAMTFVLAVKQLLHPHPKLRENKLFLSLMAGTISLAGGIVTTVATDRTAFTLMIHILEAILTTGMTYFLSVGCGAIFSKKPWRLYDQREVSSIVILGILAIISLCGIESYGNNPGRIVAVILILCAAYAGGISETAVVAISSGIALALYDPAYAIIGSVYVAAGFLTAVFRPLGKIGQIASFILINLFGLIVVDAAQGAIYTLLDVLIGTTAFLLIPEKWLRRLAFPAFSAALSTDPAESQSGIRAKLDFASHTLLDLQSSICQVSKKMDQLAARDLSTLYDQTADHLCRRCGLKMYCWDHAYDDIIDAFSKAGQILRAGGKITKAELPPFFTEKCCKRDDLVLELNDRYQRFLVKEQSNRKISDARLVAIEQFSGIADMLCEVGKEFSEIKQFDLDAQEKVNELLETFGEPNATAHCMLDRAGKSSIEIYNTKPFQINLALLTDAISERLNRQYERPDRVCANGKERLCYTERATYQLEFFAVQQAALGNQVCGDCYRYFQDGKGAAHLILSDGMGNGTRAAIDSVITCNLFLKLIQAGFGFESALKLLNSSLLVKSGEESLSTLDVGRIDLYTGQAEFRKAGAVVSFVCKGEQVLSLGEASLPVGILQNVEYDRAEILLEEGDIVIMLSDGVLETGADWIRAEIELRRDNTARELAEELCKEAGRRRIDGHSDDLTVLVAKLKKAG